MLCNTPLPYVPRRIYIVQQFIPSVTELVTSVTSRIGLICFNEVGNDFGMVSCFASINTLLSEQFSPFSVNLAVTGSLLQLPSPW